MLQSLNHLSGPVLDSSKELQMGRWRDAISGDGAPGAVAQEVAYLTSAP